jgi:hypothetical protein
VTFAQIHIGQHGTSSVDRGEYVLDAFAGKCRRAGVHADIDCIARSGRGWMGDEWEQVFRAEKQVRIDIVPAGDSFFLGPGLPPPSLLFGSFNTNADVIVAVAHRYFPEQTRSARKRCKTADHRKRTAVYFRACCPARGGHQGLVRQFATAMEAWHGC